MNERSQGGGNRASKGKGSGGKANQSNSNQSKANQSKAGGKKRGKSRSRGGRSKKVDPSKYWGSLDALPAPSEHTTTTPNPSTLLTSLGRPPVPGHENASKHYFSLVYERASNLAVALAAAGGLNDFAVAPSNGDDDSSDSPDSTEHGDQPTGTDAGPDAGAAETATAGSAEGPAE